MLQGKMDWAAEGLTTRDCCRTGAEAGPDSSMLLPPLAPDLQCLMGYFVSMLMYAKTLA